MNKRHYEHTLPNIRGSLSNTYFSPYFLFCHHIMIKVAFIRNFYTQRIVSRNKSNLMGLEPSFSILIVRFPVPVHQHPFNVGSPVQDFSSYPDIWQYAVVAVIL